MPNYPSSLQSPPEPNRLPLCENTGANAACGRTNTCLLAEPSQPLVPGQNRYLPGQQFEVPWLISVVHGNGNRFDLHLGHSASGITTTLLSDFPQGDNLNTGAIIALGFARIPTDFPAGAAVLEAVVETGSDSYYDCLDVHIMTNEETIFSAGFEPS